MTKFVITARRDGFRRAGIAHPAAPVEHRLGHFTDEQIETLLGESMLIVEPHGGSLEQWLEAAAADRELLRDQKAAAEKAGDGEPKGPTDQDGPGAPAKRGGRRG